MPYLTADMALDLAQGVDRVVASYQITGTDRQIEVEVDTVDLAAVTNMLQDTGFQFLYISRWLD